MNEFLERLKQRKLVQWAIAYVAAAFALLQGIDIVAQRFGWPEQTMRIVIIALSVGLFVTLVLAWYHGERGAQRVGGTELLILALLLAIGGGFLWRFAGTSRAPIATQVNSTTSVFVPEKSVAVLPFENLSSDKENAYFTDGVQDEILTDLAKIADLKVISRRSVMAYKSGPQRNLRQIAQELGVVHILEGSVQRANDRVRVSAQLLDARSDAYLWAERYDRPLDDVFAIQSEIAKAIADQLQAKLLPGEKAAIERPPTADLAAFDLYTRAKALLVPFGSDQALQAIGLLNQALTRDPEFLLAYCKLAAAHDLLYLHGKDPTPDRLTLAQGAVNSALRLRPDSGEAHLALAMHLYSSHDYDRARAELTIVRDVLPNDAQAFELSGNIDRRQGRWEESIRNFKRAVELDPRNVETLQQLSYLYQALRRYPEMAAVLDRALEVFPKDVDTRVARSYVDLQWRADGRPLHATIEAILAENPASAPALAWWWVHLAFCERDSTAVNRALVALSGDSFGPANVTLTRTFGEGLLARVRGDVTAAHAAFAIARAQQMEVVRALPEYAPALCALGLIDAGLGRKEEALSEGRRAVELLSVEKDAIVGADLVEFFAIICAWAGENDLAVEQLATATKIPGRFLSYGALRLHPFWDPLRGDPRFEKIVEFARAERETLISRIVTNHRTFGLIRVG